MPPADVSSAVSSIPAPSAVRLRECRGCGLVQRIPALASGATAACTRCGAVLARRRSDPSGRALAMALTGLCLFVLHTQMPFMDLDRRERVTALISGPVELEQHGLWELSVVVLVTTIAAPLAKLVAMIWVLVGVRLRRPPRHLLTVFRWVEWL